ncbi:hypothetical protein CISG_04737 [Coccidioides immitis RMSCC 3703]|uniref:Uncharacterized protein n=1 Tax=Coccidioides immitis RMSCC 3703 TaxID=454286 RepID=A0A0J8QVI3_COCIT|nr:hypothetical protein CISG_04737 [Coccidioides immitis RMSCC 3703]
MYGPSLDTVQLYGVREFASAVAAFELCCKKAKEPNNRLKIKQIMGVHSIAGQIEPKLHGEPNRTNKTSEQEIYLCPAGIVSHREGRKARINKSDEIMVVNTPRWVNYPSDLRKRDP